MAFIKGRIRPWSMLMKDMPRSKHHDIDFIVASQRSS
jgi:hypothetical protein